MKAVFILGAGCSSEAGVPVLSNFMPFLFKEVREYYETKLKVPNNNSQDNKNLQNILVDLEKLKVGMENILGEANVEELLSFLDFSDTINSDRSNDLKNLGMFLRDFILKTIIVGLKKTESSEEGVEARRTYGLFKTAIVNSRCPVITFNWDLLVDQEFGNNSIDYGIDEISEGLTVTEKFLILKLHGSMNWVKNKDGSIEVKGDKINAPEHLRGIRPEETPLIVMPTFSKFTPELENGRRIDNYEILGKIWERAKKELISADVIFIVGFSFPDTDLQFKLFFRNAILENQKLRKNKNSPEIIVVSRPKRLLQERLSFEEKYDQIIRKQTKIEPQFYYFTFSNFAKILPTLTNSLNNEKQFLKAKENLGRLSFYS